MIRRRVMVCHQTSKVPSFPGSLERCLEMKRGEGVERVRSMPCRCRLMGSVGSCRIRFPNPYNPRVEPWKDRS